MFCCRCVHTTKRQLLSLIFSKEPVVTQETDNHVTKVESVSLDRTIRRFKIWKEASRFLDDSEIDIILNEKVESPWLHVLAKSPFGEMNMTDTLNQYLVSGNVITPEFLNRQFPFHYDWSYLDAVTFKELYFPSGGITIHAPRVETITQENQEDKDTR
jgi:hypothetical protein